MARKAARQRQSLELQTKLSKILVMLPQFFLERLDHLLDLLLLQYDFIRL
jgi:hypothetical protein